MGQDEQQYVIAITEDSYSGGEALATALAERFEYSLVTLETLLKRAPAFGADPEKLRALIENPPGLLRGILIRHLATLRILRCVLAETIRSGNTVCYGDVAYLLPFGIPEIYHLRVASPFPARLKVIQEAKQLDRILAGKRLNDSDSKQSRWRSYVHRSERTGSSGIYDSTVNLEETSTDEIGEMIELMMARRNTASEDAWTALLDFVLAARIEGELALEPATAHLEIEAEVSDGFVLLHGSARTPNEIDAVMVVANSVRGVKRVDSKNVRLMPLAADFPMLASVRSKGPKQRRFWLPGFAGIAAIALLVFGMVHIGSWIREIRQVSTGNSSQVFAGVITDTVCAATRDPAKQTAECVRACVQRPGVEYALYDGKRSYVISDQSDAAKMAAQHVVIRGRIDTSNGMLLVRSIQEQ